MHWGLLPPATKTMRETSKLAKGRFTGDPSYEFEHVETKKVGEGEDATEEEETVTIYLTPFLNQENNCCFHLIVSFFGSCIFIS